ncbi:MAG: GtrA family protein [Hyphomicrobiales bacterium]|nr:MAG: GtrA family protein [Hyphomicrobiales bacterium]
MKLKDEAGRLDLSRLVRHGAGFLISGTVAFCVDAITLQLLTTFLDIDPIFARLGSISVAMVAGWLSHRRLTFAVASPPTVNEFLRYAGVAWFSAAVNYMVFVALMLIWEDLLPVLGIAIASIVAMCVSYLGMRFAAFRVPNA